MCSFHIVLYHRVATLIFICCIACINAQLRTYGAIAEYNFTRSQCFQGNFPDSSRLHFTGLIRAPTSTCLLSNGINFGASTQVQTSTFLSRISHSISFEFWVGINDTKNFGSLVTFGNSAFNSQTKCNNNFQAS